MSRIVILFIFITLSVPVYSVEPLYTESFDQEYTYFGDNGILYFNGVDNAGPGVPVSPLFGDAQGIPISPNDTKIARVPWLTCFIGLFHCQRDKQLEIDLEIEFWGHALSEDAEGMNRWTQKAIRYAQLSKTPYAYRIYKLSAFGINMVFAKNPIYSSNPLKGLFAVIKSLAFAKKAVSLEPNDLMSQYTVNFGEAYVGAVLFSTFIFNKEVNQTIDYYYKYGLAGFEGKTFGHMMQLFVNKEDIVSQGLEGLNHCLDDYCNRRTTIAPGRKLGNVLTMLEALYTQGRTMEAEILYSDTLSQAYEEGEHEVSIEKFIYKKSVLDTSDIVDVWQSGHLDIGLAKMPSGPFQKTDACALCHMGVEVLPAYYEGR